MPDGPPRIVSAAGQPGATTASWPLEHEGEGVGLLLASPRRGGTFAALDRRLLTDLAARAGAAVHAVGLAHDLEQARARLVMAREEERRRLHRDLHDDLGATLGALTLKAGAAHALLEADPAGAAVAIEEVEHELQASVVRVRQLVYALRPPALDDRGLRAAIEDNLVHHRSALSVDVEVEPAGEWPPLPAAVELAAYRIAQEGLANALRHSGGRHCRVRLSLREDAGSRVLVLDVTDDGVGLPVQIRRGVGLDSMQERAAELGGRCSIGTDPAGGVRVTAVLPVPAGPVL
jgi:signal transduction histidine kinase